MPTPSIGTLRIVMLVAAAIIGAAIVASGLGCQRSSRPISSPAPSETAPAVAQASVSAESSIPPTGGVKSAKQRDTTGPSERPASSKPRDAQPTAPPSVAEPFVAPYPHRMDPFHRPDLHKLVEARGSARGDGADVRLKGFVNVDGLKALLLVDGNVVSVRPGEECAGVEVIEVAPPRVILQRGRLRWTEDLSTVQ